MPPRRVRSATRASGGASRSSCRTAGIVSKALDNRLGAYVALEAARRIAEAGDAAVDVVAVATVQEEIGHHGARAAAFALEPDVALAIDVTCATDVPGGDPRRAGKVELGSGAAITRGPVDQPRTSSELLVAAAEEEEIPHTFEVYARPHAHRRRRRAHVPRRRPDRGRLDPAPLHALAVRARLARRLEAVDRARRRVRPAADARDELPALASAHGPQRHRRRGAHAVRQARRRPRGAARDRARRDRDPRRARARRDRAARAGVRDHGPGAAGRRRARRRRGRRRSAPGCRSRRPADTINKVCASSIRAVEIADSMIRAGDAELVVTGGMESMSNAPYALAQARFGYRLGDGTLIDLMIHDGLVSSFDGRHMVEQASFVSRELGISREEQDAWAFRSHQRAVAAIDAGPVRATRSSRSASSRPTRARAATRRSRSSPRSSRCSTRRGRRPPATRPGVNDGASCVLVASEEWARRRGHRAARDDRRAGLRRRRVRLPRADAGEGRRRSRSRRPARRSTTSRASRSTRRSRRSRRTRRGCSVPTRSA